MAPTPLTGAHLNDGVLVRLLDGELDPGKRATAEAHLDACAGCRSRLALLRRRGLRLGDVLERTDFPVPPSPTDAPGDAGDGVAKVIPFPRPATAAPLPRRDRRWLRAAAVVFVVLGVGVLATPARAWIAEWIAGRWAELTDGGEAPAPRPAPVASPARTAPAAPTPAARVQFTPAGSEFSLEVAHRQAAGAVTLERASGAAATAEVVGGTGAADLLVLPAGLRIGNEPGSAAEYRVSVPAGVRRVRVRVAGEEAVTLPAAEIGAAGRRIELARP